MLSLDVHVAQTNNLPASIMASSSSASKLNSNTALAFAAGAAAAAALVGGIAWLRGSGKDDAEQEEESVRVSKAALARLEAHSAACNRVLDTLFDALDKNGDGGITVRSSVVMCPCSSSGVVLVYNYRLCFLSSGNCVAYRILKTAPQLLTCRASRTVDFLSLTVSPNCFPRFVSS